MSHDASPEYPEQLLSQELMRISAALQRGDRADDTLLDLFEVLIHYGRERDCDPHTLNDHVRRFSEPAEGSRDNHRRSILMALLQDIQTRVRCRGLNVAERIAALDAARQANASYGGVAHGRHSPQAPPAFRFQS